MPRRTVNNGATATVDEVIELHELGNLAQEWAVLSAQFPSEMFDRYKSLCEKYSIDSAILLYVYQNKHRSYDEGELSGRVPVDQLTVITEIPVDK